MPERETRSEDRPRGRPDRGGQPERPTQLPGGSWWAAVKRTVREYQVDNLSDWAAALTYYSVLSIFAALLVLISLIDLAGQTTIQTLLDNLGQVAPGSVNQILAAAIGNLQQTSGSAGVVALVGLAAALWSASSYIGAFMRASNAIYDVPEGRPIWKTLPIRIAVTVLVMVLLTVSAVAVVADYLALHGRLVVIGKEPDGDSVSFIADRPEHYAQLKNGHRVHPSADGSVQLRLEEVDAPELHYGTAGQPLGREARDQLLAWVGFTTLEYAPPGRTRVTAATPEAVPAVIFTQAVERNGFPVAYLVTTVGEAEHLPSDGAWVLLDQVLLDHSYNTLLVQEGVAYPTVYSSTPVSHQAYLRGLATQARDGAVGVWADDMTGMFTLEDQASVGPEGQLVLPKLFRRATDYLRDVAGGFRGNLADWLTVVSTGQSRDENDRVIVGGMTELRLSDLLVQANNNVRFQADLLDTVFVER
jgi:endonuclease YncB( thermonuclease family)